MLLGGRDKIEVHFSVTDSPSNTKVKGSGVTKGRAKGYQEARKKVEERRSPTLNPKPSLTTLTPEGTYAEEKKEPPRFTGTTFKDRTETSPLPYRDLKSRDLSSPEKKAVRLAWTAQSSTAQSGTVQEAGTTKSESSRGHRARRDNSEPEVKPSRQADLGLKSTRREDLKQKNGTQVTSRLPPLSEAHQQNLTMGLITYDRTCAAEEGRLEQVFKRRGGGTIEKGNKT